MSMLIKSLPTGSPLLAVLDELTPRSSGCVRSAPI